MARKSKNRSKKKSKGGTPKKPRNDFIYIGFEKPDQTFKVVAAFQRKEHDRDGKEPKTILRTPFPVGPGPWPANQETAWLRYERLFVIDTNTRNGLSSCIAAMVILQPDPAGAIRVQRCELFFHGVLRDTMADPEMQAVCALIGEIQRAAWFSLGQAMAIATDSNLGQHTAINSRSQPISNDKMLPPGMELLYASADKRNDSLLNKVMAECDKHATRMLDAYLSGEKPLPW